MLGQLVAFRICVLIQHQNGDSLPYFDQICFCDISYALYSDCTLPAPLLRLSSIFISPSSEHNRGVEEIYTVHKAWQMPALCEDFQFIMDFHQ